MNFLIVQLRRNFQIINTGSSIDQPTPIKASTNTAATQTPPTPLNGTRRYSQISMEHRKLNKPTLASTNKLLRFIAIQSYNVWSSNLLTRHVTGPVKQPINCSQPREAIEDKGGSRITEGKEYSREKGNHSTLWYVTQIPSSERSPFTTKRNPFSRRFNKVADKKGAQVSWKHGSQGDADIGFCRSLKVVASCRNSFPSSTNLYLKPTPEAAILDGWIFENEGINGVR